MDSGVFSETRREPIHGGSTPTSLLVTVSEKDSAIHAATYVFLIGNKTINADAEINFSSAFLF
jgi:hypothetical protein